jgi:DNA uptake protein ComE-like DNA-binding protein
MILRAILFSVAVGLFLAPVYGADRPPVVVLEETGQMRDGVPVLRPYPDQQRVAAVLERGFSGRMLRLFQYEQAYLHKRDGLTPEPAYLLLSSKQGGFPRAGFYLGPEDKRHAGYVDLPRGQTLSGQFGAVDQIFPHEFTHIILHQLAHYPVEGAGQPHDAGSNQIHAIGVRTDPATAFDEGLAEHAQVQSIEDPDADPTTRALADDTALRQRTYKQFAEYRRELAARWSPATRYRTTFLLWFSGAEQALRYYAVKENAFAYEPEVPRHLLSAADPYSAYLLENIVPGTPRRQPKSVARMLSTEGVVSAFMYRWANSVPLRAHYRDKAFYAQFDAAASDVTPLENVYLKMFHVFYTHQIRNTVQLIAAYKMTFPDEAANLDAVVRDAFAGQPLPTSPAIWLANSDFHTGTSVFDQFRCAPRVHTFDLNAASEVDLVSIPGVDRTQAESILKAAPYASLNELQKVAGFTPALMHRFDLMAAEMNRVSLNKEKMEEELPIRAILLSYLWHALGWIFLAGLMGAALYRGVRKVGIVRLVVNGLAAAFLGLLVGWLIEGDGFHTLLAVLVVFGLPGALLQLGRHRSWRGALGVLCAWTMAAVPAAVLVRPWF